MTGLSAFMPDAKAAVLNSRQSGISCSCEPIIHAQLAAAVVQMTAVMTDQSLNAMGPESSQQQAA